MIYIIIFCSLAIGFLAFKLSQKQKIDRNELAHYQKELDEIQSELILTKHNYIKYQELAQQTKNEYTQSLNDLNNTKEKHEYEEYKLEECRKDLEAALEVYKDITDNKLKEIDASIEEQRQKRQSDLDSEFTSRRDAMEQALTQTQLECEKSAETYKEALATIYEECHKQSDDIYRKLAYQQEKFEGIQKVLKQYDADKQAKLYYTIQLPEEYYEDIEFLLTTVAAKVQHPDIISKLVWQEYVKPNLDNTFKRLEVKPDPGIYKLTSIENGKCYIGKSTDIKRRITDHFKSVVGISSIADQAVHHAIRKEGFWNWTIEVITYCTKEQLNELEKYYIEFFKSQEFGYNKTGGG